MALHSPAIQASRPSSFVDPHRSGEYPVFLSDSLTESSRAGGRLLSVRYNWKPKEGSAKQRATLLRNSFESGPPYKLIVESGTHDREAYVYEGRDAQGAPEANDEDTELPTASLALVFDNTRSAFILEPISTSFNFNLTSAPGQSAKSVKSHQQITLSSAQGDTSDSLYNLQKNTTSQSEDEGDIPDSENPYDYRHFLAEARENAEKASTVTVADNRTPIPGSRTPLGGIPSPVPGATRILSRNNGASTTPQFRPVPTSAPAQKKRKGGDHATSKTQPSPPRSHPSTSAPRRPTARGRKGSKPVTSSSSQKALSKERIEDSDEELSDTTVPVIDLGRNHTSSKIQTPGSSVHIVVDEPSGLEIDMGSPPPAARQRKKHVNPDAFRSHSGTPRIGVESESLAAAAAAARRRRQDEEEQELPTATTDADGDVDMEDADVEALDLGSPRTMVESRRASGTGRIESALAAAAQAEEEDEDDGLEAAIEAALEDADDAEPPVGLGIAGAPAATGPDEDESEVSEEE